MPASSLRDIEQAMTTLWTRRAERTAFLDGKHAGVDKELIDAIDQDGVELYAGLINHGQQDLMLSIYPLTARLLGNGWEGLIDDYFEAHPPDHFNLNRAARHLPEFLAHYNQKWLKRFPFLVELADYEWLELEIMEIEQLPPPSDLSSLEKPEQFQTHGPIINPALSLRKYRFPIIKIAEQLESSKLLPRNVNATETYIAVYRDLETNRCRFLEVAGTAYEIIKMAATQPSPAYAALITYAVGAKPNADPHETVAEFLQFVEDLQDKGMFLGNKMLAGPTA